MNESCGVCKIIKHNYFRWFNGIWGNSFRLSDPTDKAPGNSKLLEKYIHIFPPPRFRYWRTRERERERGLVNTMEMLIRSHSRFYPMKNYQLQQIDINYMHNRYDDFSLALVKQFMIICLTTMCHTNDCKLSFTRFQWWIMVVFLLKPVRLLDAFNLQWGLVFSVHCLCYTGDGFWARCSHYQHETLNTMLQHNVLYIRSQKPNRQYTF